MTIPQSKRVSDFSQNDFAMQSKQPNAGMLLVIILLVITMVGGYLAYKSLSSKNDQDTDSLVTPTPTATITVEPTISEEDVTPTPEEDIEPTLPAGAKTIDLPSNWKPIDSISTTYLAYRPSNYYFRYFGGSTESLGIDPAAIPAASSYGGVITMSVSSGDLDTVLGQFEDSLESDSTSKVTYQNGEWTIIMGTVPESEIEAAKDVKIALIEVDGKVYTVTLNSSSANTNFEIFVANLEFTRE